MSRTVRDRDRRPTLALRQPAIHVTLAALSLLTLFPLIWMLTAAFTPNDDIGARPFRLVPDNPTLENFRMASTRHPIWAWLANSVLIAGAITVGKLLLSVPAAFALARLRFPGRAAIFWILIATMSFPAVMAIIPTYVGVVKLGAFDTYGAAIIPMIPYLGFYIFFLRQAFLGLPAELFEAARLDGAGTLRQIVEIALPNVLPALASLGVFAFMGAWNIYLWAQLVLETRAKKTLTTGIALFADLEGGDRLWGPLMATSLLSILPVLAVFVVAQRWIMDAFVPSAGQGK